MKYYFYLAGGRPARSTKVQKAFRILDKFFSALRAKNNLNACSTMLPNKQEKAEHDLQFLFKCGHLKGSKLAEPMEVV